MNEKSRNFPEPGRGALPDAPAGAHRFSHSAMATVFQVLIVHEDRTYAGQAALEAFRIADAVELELSRFLPNSDIGRINRMAPGGSTRVGIHAFECLRRSKDLSDCTGGAFDIFAGAVKDAWMNGGRGLSPRAPDASEAARRAGGRGLVLDEESFSVSVPDSVTVDLGAFGKGYAVDRMAETLREWDIGSALVHGGKSSVAAFGTAPGSSGWPVTISHPLDRGRMLLRVTLNGRAMGASGIEKGPHIIDPFTGEPVRNRLGAWALAQDAAAADALSTAFMIMPEEAVRRFCLDHPDVQAVLADGPVGETIRTFGFSDRSGP